MSRSEIITLIIAAYGAVLSTIAILVQLLSDRAKVKLKVRRNMKTHNAPQYEGMTIVTVDVVNTGRRPVTITTVAATGLYPRLHFVAMDNTPPLPHEITEGKYITTILNQAEIDLPTIDYWSAYDSHSRVYMLREASLFKHWKSEIQRKWSGRNETNS